MSSQSLRFGALGLAVAFAVSSCGTSDSKDTSAPVVTVDVAPSEVATDSGNEPTAQSLVPTTGSSSPAARPKISIVATFYPLAWMVERIGGDRVSVTNLTPPGVEPHDLELAPDQVDALTDADLAVVMGRSFQPGPEKIAGGRSKPTVVILEAVGAGEGLVEEHQDDAVGHDHADGLDPHVWLDPRLFSAARGELVGALSAIDPSGASEYVSRSEALGVELAELDRSMETGLKTCSRRTIVTAHEAFGRLASRYGLTQEGIAGLSPDAEPDAQRIAELADLVKKQGLTTVFFEELAPQNFADTLAREAGVKTAMLSPLEAPTPDEIASGSSYLTVMQTNLETLRAALDCG